MARQDYERDDDRYEGREQRYGRTGDGGEREETWRPGGRRQGSGREYSDVRERGYGREQDWRGGSQGYEGGSHRGSERTRQMGQAYGAGEHGTQEWGEGRYGEKQDREYRERTEGYGGRGWESTGLGGPNAYGSGSYGGSSMYGGSYMGPSWNPGMAQRQGMGQHFGRGPKGYRRSDERIREDVNEALFRDEHVDATEIEIEVLEGEVTLSGTVDSREARRMAEDCVWNVSGVRNVTNTIRLESDKHGDPSKRGATGTSGGADDPSKTRRMGQSGQTGQKTGSNT
jgi:hypothetical protein